MTGAFVLAWVMLTFDTSKSPPTYSPPVETAADCEKLRAALRGLYRFGPDSVCVQVSVKR